MSGLRLTCARSSRRVVSSRGSDFLRSEKSRTKVDAEREGIVESVSRRGYFVTTGPAARAQARSRQIRAKLFDLLGKFREDGFSMDEVREAIYEFFPADPHR
jgi:DNA-binding transcriptional regulator YhcF (GntR family)